MMARFGRAVRGIAVTSAVAATLVMAILAGAAMAVPARADEFEGLPAGPGQEETYYGCVACHSMAIIKQQRLSRRVWDEVLTWMVDEKGMPELDPATRQTILDYLVTHYGRDVPR